VNPEAARHFAMMSFWFARIAFWFARMAFWLDMIVFWFAVMAAWFFRIFDWFATVAVAMHLSPDVVTVRHAPRPVAHLSGRRAAFRTE
jgi:hypothetical protein